MAPAGLAVAGAVANQGKTVLAVMVAVRSCWFCWTVSKLSILFFSPVCESHVLLCRNCIDDWRIFRSFLSNDDDDTLGVFLSSMRGAV